MALITGNDPLLTDLDYDNLSAANQAKVDAILEVGTELIEKYCNRTFLADDYTEYLDGTDHNEIYIKNPPINSLTSVVLRYGSVADADETYTTNYFEFDSGSGRISFSDYNITTSETLTIPCYFPLGYRNIIVSYNGGYSTVPEPIQFVLADFAQLAYDQIGQENIEAERLGNYFYKTASRTVTSSSGSSGDNSSGLGDEISDKYYRILKLYKLFTI